MDDREDRESIDETKMIEPTKANTSIYKDYGKYYDQPEDKTGEGYGRASLVLGIISVLCTFFLPVIGLIPSVLAILFGIIGLKAIKSGIAIAGLSLGIVSLLPQLLLAGLLISSRGGIFLS